MNICHLVNDVRSAGAQALLLDMVKNSDSNLNFTVCCMGSSEDMRKKFEKNGANVIDLTNNIPFSNGRRSEKILSAPYLIKFLSNNDFDILHNHLAYSINLGRIVGKIVDIDIIISTHHNIEKNHHPIHRHIERVTRSFDSATVAVSDGVKESYIEESFDPQWHTIHNGIDFDEFRTNVNSSDTKPVENTYNINSDETIFVNVGRYVEAKKQVELIKAMENVVNKEPQSKLFIVGSGELEEKLNKKVDNLGLENHVFVTGYVQDIHQYYSIGDVYVSSSKNEGLPITLLEAMASGLPIVATDIPGVREVINENKTGYLVPPHKPEALARSMLDLTIKDKQNRFGEQGYNRGIEKFDIESTISNHAKLYSYLMKVHN